MKLKFWLAFGDNPIFSSKDIPIFLVVPRDGNKEQALTKSCFVEADSLEQARDKMKAKIDDWYDHVLHMEKLEKSCQDKAAGIVPPTPPKPKPVLLDETSLSIGGEGDSLPSRTSDGLLDLGDLLK